MSSTRLIALSIYVHIQSLCLTNSQYTQIWYDSMESNTDWHCIDCDGTSYANSFDDCPNACGSVVFGKSSSGCYVWGSCTEMMGVGNTGIYRFTDITDVCSLELQYWLNRESVHPPPIDAKCVVSYAYDNINNKILLRQHTGYSQGSSTITIPSSQSSSKLWIFLELDGPALYDYCFWERVYLRGSPECPTQVPTDDPNKSPTANPTSGPTTARPSSNPSVQPTSKPTNRPTLDPTLQPTNRPTSPPFKMPSHIPSNYPSTNPTTSPTKPVRLLCGGDNVGTYTEGQITFDVTMHYDGEMIFDARGSNFPVTSIQIYNAFGGVLGNDSDNNGAIMILAIAGDYTIDIEGNVTGTGIYHVDLVCASAQPTQHPKSISIIETHTASSTTNAAYQDNYVPPNRDVIQWIEMLVPEQMALYVAIALILLIICCCGCVACLCCKRCKRKKDDEPRRQTNSMVNIQMGNKHEVHQIVPCDVDFEREMVTLWIRDTVQLPQYVHLFLSQGYDTIQAIQHIECKEDLDALGIPSGAHQTLILTQIKRLKGTDFVVKGITHGAPGAGMVTTDDGQGHTTKPPPPGETTSADFIASGDSDSDDSLYTRPKEKQKQKHQQDYLTVEGEFK
eukprot:638770_1